MERRVLIAVILSFVVLYAFQTLFPSPPLKPAPKPLPKSSQTGTAAATPDAQAPPRSATSTALPESSSAVTAPSPASSSASPARILDIDTPYVHGAFTTRGAVLTTWELKKFSDIDGRPLNVIAAHAPPDQPLPFTVAVDDPAVSARLATAPFTVVDTTGPAGSSGVWRATFDYTDGSGLHVRKTFVNDRSKPYVIALTVSVTQGGRELPATIEWGPALASGIVPKSRTYNPPAQPLFFKDGKVTRVAQAKIQLQPTQEGTFGFVGVDDHYFLTALVTPPTPLKVDYVPVDVSLPSVPEGAHYVSWSMHFPAPVTQPLTFFVGPKDFDILAAVDRDLVRSIDFGVFAWLVVPLLRALKWINAYVGNFGWSVIILTILINIAMFPIRHKSVVSMRRMQEVQPEAKAIQDRYKNLKISDPARAKMNEELMALYKQRGVNPAGGCLPMVLTLPVLYAFYALLEVAIELRGAPWIWWVHDLSARDPYYILPILMGVTMFVQQKMTPTTPDPTQQKMMLFMPVVLTGMFLWFASGLVLYYTVNNLFGIVQQSITYKLIGPPPVRTVRPPAERRVKRVGPASPDPALKERQ